MMCTVYIAVQNAFIGGSCCRQKTLTLMLTNVSDNNLSMFPDDVPE